jgi:hypothetical protein
VNVGHKKGICNSSKEISIDFLIIYSKYQNQTSLDYSYIKNDSNFYFLEIYFYASVLHFYQRFLEI